MEGGGSLAGGGGGLYAAQEPREGEEEKAGRQPRAGGGMKFRVSARAPHGVGALLLIGGAVLAGAAVVAWRHARRGKRGRNQPAKKEEVSDDGGGVVEVGKAGASAPEIDRPDDKVQCGASPGEIDHPDDSLRAGEEEVEIGSNGLDNVGVTQEIEEVDDDVEIVADEVFQNSGQVQKIDLDLGKSFTEILRHDDLAVSEPVEKRDQDSSTKLPETTTHDMDSVTVERGEENSVKNSTDNDHNATNNDIEKDQDPTTNHMENDEPTKNDLKREITPNDKEDVDACDKCSHSISRPGIVLDEQSLRGDGAHEAESMENSPTAQLMMHPEQLLDDNDTKMDTEGETAEAKLGKGTVLHKDVQQQGQQTAMAEPVGLAGSPALSSLIKPAEKKEPELPGRVETGMKTDQDYTKGELKDHHGLITKGATPEEAVVTMDRRSYSTAILALMFALTIGITIVVRLYAPPRATKLQMDLQ